MAKTREQLEAEAKFFDCQESEVLRHTDVFSAVDAVFDDCADSEIEGPIEVACYVPHEWTEARRAEWADWLVTWTHERFDDDEDLAPEDGLSLAGEALDAVEQAARAFIDVFAQYANPWGCVRIGSFHLSPDEVRTMLDESR